MKRVAIVGPPGSGKSTLARRIGEITGLPVIHLDTIWWKPGWVESDPDEFLAAVRARIAEDRWITDGNYNATLPERLRVADCVVFLDLPRWLYMTRILKRRAMYARRGRPDMTDGCVEQLDRTFVWDWARLWHLGSRERKVEMLREHPDPSKVVWLRTRAEVKEFLIRLTRTQAGQSSTPRPRAGS